MRYILLAYVSNFTTKYEYITSSQLHTRRSHINSEQTSIYSLNLVRTCEPQEASHHRVLISNSLSSITDLLT
jgi:hypothetical protein